MSWYKLDVVRNVLREYGAVTLPSVIGQPNVEVWKRTVKEHDYWAFLNYESDELLVPQESLVAAAEGLRLPADFLETVRSEGGLWLGPAPDA